MAARISKFFSGDIELNAERIRSLDNAKFAEQFPGVVGKRFDGYAKLVAPVLGVAVVKWSEDVCLPVTRIIHYSKRPSLHKCDARCMNAKGHNCECSCGGKNHGKNG